MLKSYKFFLFFISLFFIVFAYATHVSSARAQQCTGTSTGGGNCAATEYNCPILSGVAICNPTTDTGAGWACGLTTFGSCTACVPNDQTCSYTYTDPNTGITSPCTAGNGCNGCDITWVNNGTACPAISKVCATGCTLYCTSGTANCTTCGGGSTPTNTCGTTSGSQTCQHNSPQTCTNSNFTQSCTYSYSNCSNNYSCPSGSTGNTNCQTYVIAHAFMDINHDGVQNSGEPSLSGVTMNNGGWYQTTGSSGSVTYSSYTSNTTVSITGSVTSPLNGVYYQNTSISKSVTLSTSNGGTQLNYGFIPMYTISGRVYNDLNHNGNSDSGTDPNVQNLTGIQVTDGNGHTVNIQSNGTFSFPNEEISNSYTISIVASTIPAGWVAETTSQTANVQGANVTGIELGISKLYTISGTVCNDPGIDGSCMQSDDVAYPYPNDVNITPQNGGTNPGNVTQSAYSSGIQVLSGIYQVSFSASNGYYFTAGKVPGKSLPPFTVTVGQDTNNSSYNCTAPTLGTTDASCDGSGDIINLNFALSNLQSWFQGFCTDMRLEAPGMDDPVPNTGSCTDSGTGVSTPNAYAIICLNNNAGAGVYYSGSNSPTFGYNNGQASVPNYQVGSTTYPESFAPVSGVNRASYTYLYNTISSSGITTQDITPYCGASGTTACNISSNIPDGVYLINGNLTLDSGQAGVPVTLPDPGGNKSYVFLINGSLTINSNVLVPTDTSVVFAAKGDIYVSGNVGVASYTDPTPNIEGFYSTEGDFWILSNNKTGYPCAAGGTPLDERLNISGGVVVGGTVQNQRELCKYDAQCPVTTYSTNYDYILYAPQFVKHKAQLWQEQAPNGQ